MADLNQQNQYQISVIVPAYTERESLAYNIKTVLRENERYIKEILIVLSAYAETETHDMAIKLEKEYSCVRCITQRRNPGLGWALREAFEAAAGTHVQILYADCESNPDAVKDFIARLLETNADMIVGSRWHAQCEITGYPLIRYIFNRVYQFVFRILYRTPIRDLTFGFNLMSVDIVKNIRWRGHKHEIATEMVLKPLRLKYHIEELPVNWHRRNEGQSKLKLIRYLLYPQMALLVRILPKNRLIR
jgi:dolichol-phosphate mannosyltransferase